MPDKNKKQLPSYALLSVCAIVVIGAIGLYGLIADSISPVDSGTHLLIFYIVAPLLLPAIIALIIYATSKSAEK